jgi:hypothetical protein
MYNIGKERRKNMLVILGILAIATTWAIITVIGEITKEKERKIIGGE